MTNLTATMTRIHLQAGSLAADVTLAVLDLSDEQLADLMNMVEIPLSLRLEPLEGTQAPEAMPAHQPAQPKAAKTKFHRTAATRMH